MPQSFPDHEVCSMPFAPVFYKRQVHVDVSLYHHGDDPMALRPSTQQHRLMQHAVSSKPDWLINERLVQFHVAASRTLQTIANSTLSLYWASEDITPLGKARISIALGHSGMRGKLGRQ